MNKYTHIVIDINILILNKTGLDLHVVGFWELKSHFPKDSFIADKHTKDCRIVRDWIATLDKRQIKQLFAKRKKEIAENKNMHSNVLDRRQEVFNLYSEAVANSTKFNKAAIARKYCVSKSTVDMDLKYAIHDLKKDRNLCRLIVKKALVLSINGWNDTEIYGYVPLFAVLLQESDVDKNSYERLKSTENNWFNQMIDRPQCKKDDWDSIDGSKSFFGFVSVWDGSQIHLKLA